MEISKGHSAVVSQLLGEDFTEGHGDKAKPRAGCSGSGQDGAGLARGGGDGDPSASGEARGAHGQVQCGQRAEDGEEVTAGDIFYDCFEGDGEETLGMAQIEARARELRKAKNFSLGMCEDLLRQFCPLGAGKSCRHAHLKEDARVTAGAYAHGGFYGVVGITYKYPETIRYLNAFLKSYGFKGSWTALSIGWNGAASLHRDPHNARDRNLGGVTGICSGISHDVVVPDGLALRGCTQRFQKPLNPGTALN